MKRHGSNICLPAREARGEFFENGGGNLPTRVKKSRKKIFQGGPGKDRQGQELGEVQSVTPIKKIHLELRLSETNLRNPVFWATLSSETPKIPYFGRFWAILS